MIRTQVYVSDKQMRALKRIAARSGKRQSELIRDAIDLLAAEQDAGDWRESIAAAAGIWRNRDDLPDFATLRRELDRSA